MPVQIVWSVAVTALIFATAKHTNYIFVEISFVQFYSSRTVDVEEIIINIYYYFGR
jgi:hypothetical protein